MIRYVRPSQYLPLGIDGQKGEDLRIQKITNQKPHYLYNM